MDTSSMPAAALPYDPLAHRYDRAHARWLRYAGGEAQCAFEGAATALLRPGMTLLDAGCGTGTVARRLIKAAPGPLAVTLVDASKNMLARCADIEGQCIHASMEALPCASNRFDLVTCAWALETVPDPSQALAELLRVTKPEGALCLVFCADRPARSLFGTSLRHAISTRRRGRFLNPAEITAQLCRFGARFVRTLHCSGPAFALMVSPTSAPMDITPEKTPLRQPHARSS